MSEIITKNKINKNKPITIDKNTVDNAINDDLPDVEFVDSSDIEQSYEEVENVILENKEPDEEKLETDKKNNVEINKINNNIKEIKLDNGQFAAQPNNRILWQDSSLILSDSLKPDFKVCTQNYRVETEPKWNVAHTDEWQYCSKDESNKPN